MSLVLAVLLTFSGCLGFKKTAAPPAPPVDQALVTKAVEGIARITDIKGFGEITMVTAGRKMSGSFDARRRNTGFFNAQVYSPFGSSVASITAEDFRGRVKIDKEQIDFAYDNSMQDVPFPCVGHFTYGRFIEVMTASMPADFWLYSAKPYSPVQGKKWVKKKGRVAAGWFTDTLAVRAVIYPKKEQIETVTFDYDIDGKKLSMQFSRFKKGVPYEILIKEGSKNYILLSYESITWK